jgi:hypothetical protein
MESFPKFIIETRAEEGDCLIIAKCTYHKQLVTDASKVKGGGWWTLDNERTTFTLHGESHDFGKAKIEDIASCVQRGKVYRSKVLFSDFNGFKFQYRNEVGEITILR